jgi:hypothetical protein
MNGPRGVCVLQDTTSLAGPTRADSLGKRPKSECPGRSAPGIACGSSRFG